MSEHPVIEALAPGVPFGEYTVESLLGRGGMGSVYLATHERLARKVALKVIASELALGDDFRTRFLRESQLAASLDHPHVIPIYDAGEVGGVLFLAMRYVPGPSLHELIRARGHLSMTETRRIASQIGGALDAAHRAGLVHRDVKPANILLAEGEHAYLVDFGLAKRTSSKGTTRTGSFLGTVDYCAPEQLRGDPVDGRADVYSLGCVLFHCLAGEPPFARDTDVAVLQAQLLEPPPSVSSARSDLPRELDDVFRTALAKEPEQRFATAGALALAFERGGSTEVDARATRAARLPAASVESSAPTTPGRGGTRVLPARRRFGRRSIAIVAAIFVAALVAATAIALATRGSAPTTDGATDAQLRTFVDRVENVLVQSADGRQEIAGALTAGFKCSISPREAGRRIGSVADNRQSILEQLGTLGSPSPQTDRVVTLLQAALQQSIEADRHYRDGFYAVANASGCPLPANPSFGLARRSDTRATRAKERFVAAFDPYAARFGRRTWRASEV